MDTKRRSSASDSLPAKPSASDSPAGSYAFQIAERCGSELEAKTGLLWWLSNRERERERKNGALADHAGKAISSGRGSAAEEPRAVNSRNELSQLTLVVTFMARWPAIGKSADKAAF